MLTTKLWLAVVVACGGKLFCLGNVGFSNEDFYLFCDG